MDLKRSLKIMHQYLACSLHDLRKGSGQDPFRIHMNFPIGVLLGGQSVVERTWSVIERRYFRSLTC